MSTVEKYRETLYSNYFKDRYDHETIKNKLAADLIHLEKEILPLLPENKNASMPVDMDTHAHPCTG